MADIVKEAGRSFWQKRAVLGDGELGESHYAETRSDVLQAVSEEGDEVGQEPCAPDSISYLFALVARRLGGMRCAKYMRKNPGSAWATWAKTSKPQGF
mgnify:CR=1 FL=1